jgi:hypothetical protein
MQGLSLLLGLLVSAGNQAASAEDMPLYQQALSRSDHTLRLNGLRLAELLSRDDRIMPIAEVLGVSSMSGPPRASSLRLTSVTSVTSLSRRRPCTGRWCERGGVGAVPTLRGP